MSVASLGRENHRHELSFKLRVRLDLGYVGQFLSNARHNLSTQLGVGDLPAPEHQRDLHLVPFRNELARVTGLRHEVVLFNTRAERSEERRVGKECRSRWA